VPFMPPSPRVRPVRYVTSASRATKIPRFICECSRSRHNGHFDTVQMPVNAMDAHFRSFTHNVIPVAQKSRDGRTRDEDVR
jgi:hypothetical protein